MDKNFCARNKLTFAAALLTALAAWLCCAPQARAQQWTTCGTNGICTSSGTGNVGVGTSSPAAKLDVEQPSGTNGVNMFMLVSRGNSNTDVGQILFRHTDASAALWNTAAIRWETTTGTDGKLSFHTAASGSNSMFQRMTIDGVGNVGVGTPSPDLTGWGATRRVLTIQGPSERGVIELANPSSSSSGGWVGSIAGMYNGRRVAQIDMATDGAADAGNIQFYTWASATSVAERMRIDKAGNVGIGTSTPDIYGFGSTVNYLTLQAVGTNQHAAVEVAATGAGNAQVAFGNATTRRALISALDGSHLVFYTNASNSGAVITEAMRITSGGTVGIGTQTPDTNYKLDVQGSINVSGNINAKYQDVAEWVPSTQKLRAGTVVVLDTTQTNHVLASTKAYDTGVAGVISDSPGVILGQGGDGKVKVATTGRVKIKVDATRAPIRVGDLLVTSEAEGVAMKSIPVDLGGTQIHRPGTIIGKALEPLEKGTGEILVLLSLQ